LLNGTIKYHAFAFYLLIDNYIASASQCMRKLQELSVKMPPLESD